MLTWVVNYGLPYKGTLKYPATLIWVSVNKSVKWVKYLNASFCEALRQRKWSDQKIWNFFLLAVEKVVNFVVLVSAEVLTWLCFTGQGPDTPQHVLNEG